MKNPNDITSSDAFNTAINMMAVLTIIGFTGLSGVGIANMVVSIFVVDTNFISQHDVVEGFGRLFITMLLTGLYSVLTILIYRSTSKWLHERENN